MMGTSAMNTLRMEFATLRERNTRVYARGTAELREAPAGPQGPAAGAEARALPRRPCPRIPAARPASPGAASSRARPPRAHARSVFSMMNLTFSSVSSVMRTVGWLAYGMAAPLRPGPARRPAPVRPRPLAAAASRRTRPVRPRPAPPSAAGAPPKRVRARLGCGFIGAGEGSGAARSHSRAVGSVLTGSGSAPSGS